MGTPNRQNFDAILGSKSKFLDAQNDRQNFDKPHGFDRSKSHVLTTQKQPIFDHQNHTFWTVKITRFEWSKRDRICIIHANKNGMDYAYEIIPICKRATKNMGQICIIHAKKNVGQKMPNASVEIAPKRVHKK